MTSEINRDYEGVYRNLMDGILKDKELTYCDKYDEAKRTDLTLQQIKGKYWRGPCWRNWPCPFTQDRSNIDEMRERLSPTISMLKRECLIESNSRIDNLARDRLKGGSNQDTKSTSKATIVTGDHTVIKGNRVPPPRLENKDL